MMDWLRSGLRRVVRAVFPRVAHGLTWPAIVPLPAFLVLFGATCVALEVANVVTFTQHWPFALLLLTPWIWWMWCAGRTGLSSFRGLLSLGVRLALFGLLVVTLAEPRGVRTDDRLTVIFAVDRSGSIAPAGLEGAMQFVSRIGRSEIPARDAIGLLTFGRNAAVQIPPKSRLTEEELQYLTAPVLQDGTNLAEALTLSAAILPPGGGRIVLVSDGAHTEGDLSTALGELRARGVEVDVLPLEYRYDEEVWVERLDLPLEVEVRQTYSARIIVSSLQAGRGVLSLIENGLIIAEQEVEYREGKNAFALPIRLREPGFYEYAAVLKPATGDQIPQNNVAAGQVLLEGEGRILIVTEPDGDPLEWEPLANTLRRADLEPRIVTAYEVPENFQELSAYDCVIFLNVAREHFDPRQIQAVHDAVYHHGVGFLMTGGPRSFGPGGWTKTPIADALPVELDLTNRKMLLNGALALVLDHSGSMGEMVPGSGASKQQLANAAAAEAIKTLGTRDFLGVVTFDSGAFWAVPFGPNNNAAEAVQRVRRIGSGGGTNMFPALEQAVTELEFLEDGAAAARHVILLTDGQSTPGDIESLVLRCQATKISISAVGVGDPASIDTSILQLLARETGGRFYQVRDPLALPRVLVREAVTLRQVAIREEPMQPQASMPSPILRGIDSVPLVHGVVTTVAKGRAELALVVPARTGEEIDDPLLATHVYGIGRTAAFTSDFSTNWGKDWLEWNQFQPLVQQLVKEISRTRRETNLRVHSYTAGSEGVIQVDDAAPEEILRNLDAIVAGPNGEKQSVRMRQVGPRRYEARFPLTGEGRYLLTVRGENEYLASGLAVPYAQEYLKFSADVGALQRIAEATGGRVLDGEETAQGIFVANRRLVTSSRPLVDSLLALLALLIPLDVAVRRIQLDWGALFGRLRRQRADSTETMGALLKRKQAATEADARRETRPEATTAATVGGSPGAPWPSKVQQRRPPLAPPPSTSDAGHGTTTSRLLDAKKRRGNPPE